LTDLNADGIVTMCHDAIKLGLFNCSSVHVEAASRELDFHIWNDFEKRGDTVSVFGSSGACLRFVC
jgi:hypothetical protein